MTEVYFHYSNARGVVTEHLAMPEFRFSSNQVGDLIAFLKTLE